MHPHAGAPHRPQQQRKLRHAGGGDSPGQGVARRRHIGRQKQHEGDRDDVEQQVRRRGGGEPVEPVQHAGHQRGEADQQQVGKGDARQRDGEGELGRDRLEPRRQHGHHLRHEDLADDGQAAEPEGHDGEGFLGEAVGGGAALGGEHAREGGDEGGVEGALAEQAAEQVGQLQGDEEGVGHRPGAEQRRDQHVAREAEHAACHGPAADRQDIAEHLSRLAQAGDSVAGVFSPPLVGGSWGEGCVAPETVRGVHAPLPPTPSHQGRGSHHIPRLFVAQRPREQIRHRLPQRGAAFQQGGDGGADRHIDTGRRGRPGRGRWRRPRSPRCGRPARPPVFLPGRARSPGCSCGWRDRCRSAAGRPGRTGPSPSPPGRPAPPPAAPVPPGRG